MTSPSPNGPVLSKPPGTFRSFLKVSRLRLYFAGLLMLQVALFIRAVPYIREGSMDYRTLYTAGFMSRTGNASRLYDYETEARLQNQVVTPSVRALPLMEPACTALFFAPLSMIPYRWSFALFFLINLSLLAGCVRLMAPCLAPLAAMWKPLPAAIFSTFLPVGIALIQGQVSIVLLFAVCGAFTMLQRGRSFQSGLLLSLTLIKFQIALPIMALFFFWRYWRLLAGFLLGGAIMAGLSVALTGTKVQREYFQTLLTLSSHLNATATQQQNGIYPSHMPNLYGLLHALLPAGIHAVATLLISAGVFLWAAFQRPSLPLALIVALAVSFHLYLHDLSLLLLPISLIFSRFAAADSAQAPDAAASSACLADRIALGASVLLLLAPLGRFLIALDQIDLIAIPLTVLAFSAGRLGDLMPAPPEPRAASVS